MAQRHGETRRQFINFGGNIQFTPRQCYAPRTESEVLELLDKHADGKIRVVGSLHSWSEAVVSEDVLIDMRHFADVTVEHGADGVVWATVGGGCKTKHLIGRLHSLSDSTIPSLGLITEQTIAGAISTGTHGSGKHSLSHYMDEIRVAAYDPDTGRARIFVWRDGPQLRAARCGLGCMGVILSVRFRCVPKYEVAETAVLCSTIDEVLARETEFPLQQFFLIPHLWCYVAQQRRPTTPGKRGWAARLYRLYWLLAIDVGFHLVIKLLASVMRSRRLVRLFYRRLSTALVIKNRTIIDASEKMFVMEHELFRHLEIEIFVPAAHVRRAAEFVREVLSFFDGTNDSIRGASADELQQVGMHDTLMTLKGTFTHHYPIAFRRILPDDTLISMACDSTEPNYSISFITYVEPRDRFLAMAAFLARSMTKLFAARLHWGKYFPLTYCDIRGVYSQLEEFRRICRQTDPKGVFCNAFVARVLGFDDHPPSQNSSATTQVRASPVG